jgi:two-component system, NtrC family, sensor kinase
MPKRRKTLKSARRAAYSIVHLQEQLERQARELEEAREERTAIAEVLRIINSSPGEPGAVFQIILDNATRICGAKFGTVYLYDGDLFHFRAEVGSPPEYAEFQRQRGPFRPAPGTHMDRIIRTKQVSYTMDAAAEPVVGPVVKIGGARSFVGVPMLKDDVLIGVFGVYRQEVRPFTEKQIALLTNFSAQAVIAIENTRLLNELRQRTADLTESLEQQTATSDVLGVISSSPGELQPVFQSMLENAVRMCQAKFGFMFRYDGDAFHNIAGLCSVPEYADLMRSGPLRPHPESALGSLPITGQVVQIADIKAHRLYAERDPVFVSGAELGGIRTLVAVPMLKDGQLIGAITIFRQDVRPFSDKQVELVKNFAAQAVIAIENARLLNELRQSLEQQTATAEVLRVISTSQSSIQPVFDAVVAHASQLCGALNATIYLRDGDTLTTHAHSGPLSGTPIGGPRLLNRNWVTGRAVLDRRTVQVADVQASDEFPEAREMSARFGHRAALAVPLLRDGTVIGAILVRDEQVRQFTDKEVELVENFAAQAVIAIENARLLNELRESLQQQTATSDVLKVISRSTFDLQSVLDTLVESAARLCEADMAATHRLRGAHYEHAASYGIPSELHDHMKAIQFEPDRGSVTGRTVLGRKVVHVHDVRSDPEYTLTAAVEKLGARTTLGVPLLREGVPIGVFILMRRSVRPFTNKQIELLSTFADQAVIAIENVRLFEAEQQRTRELAKSLEDLRTAQDRLVQTQKLASLGQLTAGIAHEIKNPLNFVNNFSGLSVELLDELQEAVASGTFDDKKRSEIAELTATLRGNLDKIAQHGKRADSIVKNMLLHSREGSGERRPVDVNALVEESLNLAYHGARAEKQGFTITLERSFDPEAGQADVFPQEITRVLLNLISNGFYAAAKRQGEADDKGHEPTLAAATKSLGDKVEIRIRDNGTGITPEAKEKMFNPFFTTKPAGEGTGLGLSISHDIIVKQHSGAIEVDTEPGEFTEFRIILPRTSA